MTKAYMSNNKCQYIFQPCYLEGILSVLHNWKQDDNPNSNRLWAQDSKAFFDGNESKYELWEVNVLRYLRIQHLHQIILSPTDQSDDMDIVEKNATFAKLIQYLDDKSLSLIRDAQDNIKGTSFVKRKAESYFSLYRANIFEKIGIRVHYRLYNKDRIFLMLWRKLGKL